MATEIEPSAAPARFVGEAESVLASARHANPDGDVTVIAPSRAWSAPDFAELWKFRELLYFLVWRDVKVRYKQTILGAAWAVLQPASMMIVFAIFFGRMAKVPAGDLAYPLFVYLGLLPWTFFATAIASAGNSVVGSERLVTKVYFPRLAIPLAAVGAAIVDFLIALVLLVGLMVWYRAAPGPQVLLVPVILLLIALAAAGVGTLLAALTVAYRDFRHVMPFLVQLWLFATPAVYMSVGDDAPPLARVALAANPLNALIAGFRAAVLGVPVPWAALGLSAALVVIILSAGLLYFRRVEDSFADVI
jgi:lipopolysaccharide transport system permease protein